MSQENIPAKSDTNPKLFITNLPPSIEEEQLKNQLQKLFEVYGRILNLNVKKNRNGQYSFAFLTFQNYQHAIKAVSQMDQKEIHGRPMKVRQDRQMEGCFHCKKQGHFAKQCPQKRGQYQTSRRRSPINQREYRRRSRSHDRYHRRSRSYSNDYKYRDSRRSRHHRHRSRSRSRDHKNHRRDYDRGYDRHKYRKQRYSRSRSRSYDGRRRD